MARAGGAQGRVSLGRLLARRTCGGLGGRGGRHPPLGRSDRHGARRVRLVPGRLIARGHAGGVLRHLRRPGRGQSERSGRRRGIRYRRVSRAGLPAGSGTSGGGAPVTLPIHPAVAQIAATLKVTRPSLHGIVVGIQELKNPQLALKYPVADARAFADVLRQYAAPLFQAVNLTELTTPAQTTRDSVVQALRTV